MVYKVTWFMNECKLGNYDSCLNWSLWLGFFDLIMARLIAGNLLCLELLTNFGWLSYGIDKHFKSSDVVYIKLQQWVNFSVVNWSW